MKSHKYLRRHPQTPTPTGYFITYIEYLVRSTRGSSCYSLEHCHFLHGTNVSGKLQKSLSDIKASFFYLASSLISFQRSPHSPLYVPKHFKIPLIKFKQKGGICRGGYRFATDCEESMWWRILSFVQIYTKLFSPF